MATRPKANWIRRMVKWDETYYVTSYEFARDGLTDTEIAEAIGVDKSTFSRWQLKHPALVDALSRARKIRQKVEAEGTSLSRYIYQRLPVELRELWDKVMLMERSPDGAERIEAFLADKGDRVRQNLWVHAMIVTDFDSNRACKMVNIPSREVKRWVQTDPEFVDLIDELQSYKKQFYESALIDQVAQGNVPSIIFANRTFNRDLGYGEVKGVEHSGSVTHNHLHAHTHLVIDPEELGLDLPTTLKILEALEAKGYRKREEIPTALLVDRYTEDNPMPSHLEPAPDVVYELDES
jgi:transcriptional regulator with XRE-family HTH domain